MLRVVPRQQQGLHLGARSSADSQAPTPGLLSQDTAGGGPGIWFSGALQARLLRHETHSSKQYFL